MKYFGTDGIRLNMNEKDNTSCLVRLGEYFARRKRKILLASDTRKSSSYLKALLLSGLLKNTEVVDIGIATTPSVSFLMREEHFDFGIMISASHNPEHYNGIKIFNAQGEKLTKKQLKKIETFIDSDEKVNYKGGSYTFDSELLDKYVAFLCDQYTLKKFPLKIAFDCANGATANIMKKIKEKLKAPWNLYFTKGKINFHCGSTKLSQLKKIVKEQHYDYGIAFDGDGDRIQMVTKNRVIDGDDLLAYFALKYHKNCVLTLLSGKDIIEQLTAHHLRFEQVPVGDSNVSQKWKQHTNWIGGETSGHLLLDAKQPTGDGIFVALIFLSQLEPKESFMRRKYHFRMINLPKTKKMEDNFYRNKIEIFFKQLFPECRLKFRFSGTENVLRILLESKSKMKLKEAANWILKVFKKDEENLCAE